MPVRVLLPRSCEAKITYDEERGELLIEPFFRRPEEQVRVLNLRVESGRPGVGALSSMLVLSGLTGKLRLVQSRQVRSVFDGGEATPRKTERRLKPREEPASS